MSCLYATSSIHLLMLLDHPLLEQLGPRPPRRMFRPLPRIDANRALARHVRSVAAAIAVPGILTGCPLRDSYYIEQTVAASGSTGSAAIGNDFGGMSAGGADFEMGGAGTAGSGVDLGGTSSNGGSEDFGGAAGDSAMGAGAAGLSSSSAGASCTWGPFGTPQLVTGLRLSGTLWGPSLSGDGLTLYLGAVDSADGENIYRATRTNRGAVFSEAERIASLISTGDEGTPSVSPDELTIYFYSTRVGGMGNRDLWVATRSSATADFGAPMALTLFNTSSMDHQPWISSDERLLLYASTGTTSQASDVWMATRAEKSQGFSAPVRVTSIDTASNEYRAVLSSDLLTIYFASDRSGGSGAIDIWYATRTTPQGDFGAAIPVPGINSTQSDQDPMLSRDDTELFFSSGRNGTNQLWRSSRTCL